MNEMTRVCELFSSELASAVPGFRLTSHIGGLCPTRFMTIFGFLRAGLLSAHGEATFINVLDEKHRLRKDLVCFHLLSQVSSLF